jgi:hypothetical protein
MSASCISQGAHGAIQPSGAADLAWKRFIAEPLFSYS